MKHIVFSDVKMTIEELDKQELIRLKMWIARAGDNAHGLPITEDALLNSKKSLIGKPVVAKVRKGFFGVDFEGHEKDEIPIGVILKEDDIFFEKDEDGVTWLCAYATIWSRYCTDASFIIERDKIKSLSMEILTDIDDDDNIVSMYFTGITLLGTFVDPAIENARAELIEFSRLSEKISQLYFAKDLTDFPKKGDNKKISLKNSEYSQFDYSYAKKIKESYPKIWKKGGNIRGNDAFDLWGKARGNSQSNAVLDWIDEREAWAARHYKDKNINGVVAAMKWGVVISRGESYMKELIDKEIKKLEDGDVKMDFSVGEKLGKSPSIDIDNSKENAIMTGSWSDPQAALLNKLLEASNHESLVKEAYLVVDGSEKGDLSINDVHYPHHKVEGDKLVVHKRGVQAAYARAKQQGLSGAPIEHIERHYKELGLDTENFEEGGNDLEEKDFEQSQEQEQEQEKVEMSANGNVDPNARAEDMNEEAEQNKEKSKEFLMKEMFSQMMKAFEEDEEESEEDENLEKMQAKVDSMIKKYADMKEEHTIYMEKMKEFEELKEFKCNYEKQMMQAEIERTMNYVSDMMPKEEMDSMRMEATKYSLENINVWANEVKAKALEFSKPIKSDGITRMGLTDEQPKKSTGSIWD